MWHRGETPPSGARLSVSTFVVVVSADSRCWCRVVSPSSKATSSSRLAADATCDACPAQHSLMCRWTCCVGLRRLCLCVCVVSKSVTDGGNSLPFVSRGVCTNMDELRVGSDSHTRDDDVPSGSVFMRHPSVTCDDAARSWWLMLGVCLALHDSWVRVWSRRLAFLAARRHIFITSCQSSTSACDATLSRNRARLTRSFTAATSYADIRSSFSVHRLTPNWTRNTAHSCWKAQFHK